METGQLLTIILAVTSFLSSIAAAVTAYFIYLTLRQDVRGQKAQLFSDIVRYYNDIYVYRNQLLTMDLTWSAFRGKYSDIPEILNSNEWRIVRQAGAFFEFLGILVKRKYLDSDMVFDMIYVNPNAWARVSETVYKIRQDYNADLWINWEYLVMEERKYHGRIGTVTRSW
jgi:hypothetical protein